MVPDLHELSEALKDADRSLRAVRRGLRRRTQLLGFLIVLVLLVGLGVSAGTFMFTRAAFCSYFLDLQPGPDVPAPTGAYGKRIVADAQRTAQRLHC